LQHGAGGVAPLCQRQVADGQPVVLPVKAVGARQPLGLQGRVVAPLQLVYLEAQLHRQRQHQFLQRLGWGGGLVMFQRGEVDARRADVAQLQPALQQQGQLPAHLGIRHIYHQAWAAPAQPANAPAAAQRPCHIAALQALPGGQPLRYPLQHRGQ